MVAEYNLENTQKLNEGPEEFYSVTSRGDPLLTLDVIKLRVGMTNDLLICALYQIDCASSDNDFYITPRNYFK